MYHQTWTFDGRTGLEKEGGRGRLSMGLATFIHSEIHHSHKTLVLGLDKIALLAFFRLVDIARRLHHSRLQRWLCWRQRERHELAVVVEIHVDGANTHVQEFPNLPRGVTGDVVRKCWMQEYETAAEVKIGMVTFLTEKQSHVEGDSLSEVKPG